MIKIISEELYGLDGDAIKELEKLAKVDGALYPERIVEVAQDPENPLHSRFEWDDSVAGQRYRLDQARSLVRHVRVVYETAEDKQIRVRAWQYQDGAYRSTRTVMTKRDSAHELMEAALNELEGFARKYAALEELAGLRSTILDYIKRLRRKLDEAG